MRMKKRLIFLKLGGSLVTDKEKPYSIKKEIIIDLARQIKEAINEDKNVALVIGNGAGSFGHFPAIKYKMERGINSEKQIYGYCIVQDAVAQLNRIIVSELLKAEINACSINPSSIIVSENGVIKDFFINPIIEMIKKGIIPVLYGDIVIDKTIGAKIFSTEQILNALAIKFQKLKIKVGMIIHSGQTKGVFDKAGKLIKIINKRNHKELEKIYFKMQGYDITGGMSHKVLECINLSRYKIKSLIFNGASNENLLKKAILGNIIEGTIVE